MRALTFYPFNANFLAPTGEKNSEGTIINTWQVISSFPVNIQPMGGELARKIYGYTDIATHRLFCGPNSSVKAGYRVEIEGQTYAVKYVARYKRHYEVLLQVVN